MYFIFDTPVKLKKACDELYLKKDLEKNIRRNELYEALIERPRQEFENAYETYVETYKSSSIHDRVNMKYPEKPLYYNIYTKEIMDIISK